MLLNNEHIYGWTVCIFLERPSVDACRQLFEAQPSAFDFGNAFNMGKNLLINGPTAV